MRELAATCARRPVEGGGLCERGRRPGLHPVFLTMHVFRAPLTESTLTSR
jgi:hypothetical protein